MQKTYRPTLNNLSFFTIFVLHELAFDLNTALCRRLTWYSSNYPVIAVERLCSARDSLPAALSQLPSTHGPFYILRILLSESVASFLWNPTIGHLWFLILTLFLNDTDSIFREPWGFFFHKQPWYRGPSQLKMAMTCLLCWTLNRYDWYIEDLPKDM